MPNPFQDEITITENKPNIEIKCFDAFGRTIPLVQNGNTINTNTLASGIYFFKVSTKTLSRLFKMIKE
ncbi:T9SS type A sorting domain-containing protein [Lacinutrix jangbogonensis]|uniref:T9SS type A sorting domain-containing protein n=1 Tax=Lacinutrix jangbogonensis TaxID=1469557 RepID=UPI0009E00BC0